MIVEKYGQSKFWTEHDAQRFSLLKEISGEEQENQQNKDQNRGRESVYAIIVLLTLRPHQ